MRAGTNTWHTVGTQLMFVCRDPAASSGLGPWRPDELRVDYQIIRLLTKTVSAPKSPGGRGKGRVSPRAQAQAKEGPQRLVCWLCLYLTAVLCFHVPLRR